MLIGHQTRFQRVPASKHEIYILGNEWVWARLSQQHCFGICVANTFWVWESPLHYFCKIGSRTTVPDPGMTLFFSPPPNANGRQEDKARGHPCIRETVFFPPGQRSAGQLSFPKSGFNLISATFSLPLYFCTFGNSLQELLSVCGKRCWHKLIQLDADYSMVFTLGNTTEEELLLANGWFLVSYSRWITC